MSPKRLKVTYSATKPKKRHPQVILAQRLRETDKSLV